jgi:hypothetical protein
MGKTLMSWFYWPEDRVNTLALLHQNWDYVVMIEDGPSGFMRGLFIDLNACTLASGID